MPFQLHQRNIHYSELKFGVRHKLLYSYNVIANNTVEERIFLCVPFHGFLETAW